MILWYVFFFPEGSDSQQLLGVFLCRGLQNIPSITDFYKISVAQDHNAIGQLGNNGQIVADVYRRGILLPNDVFYGRQDFDLCGDIQRSRRFIKYDDIRLPCHRHCHHGTLELATGNLVRVPIPDPLRIRKVEAAVEIDRLFLRFGKRHQAVLNRAFRKLVDEEDLPSELVEAIDKFKFRGSSGKVNLSLDALPEFTAMKDKSLLQGGIYICPTTDFMEQAYDDAKYDDFSRKPFLECVIPTTVDPTMAPPGKHVMSIFVQWASYNMPKYGDRDQQRDAFGKAVIDTLAEYAPNIKDLILHQQVLTPWDIENITGLTQGNIFGGELTLDQLFVFRPAIGWSDYKTPIRNYYQCGSGTHPGGGITAGPARLAALQILKDGK